MKDGNAHSIALCIYHIVLSIVLLSIVDTSGLIMEERITHNMLYILCVGVFSKLENKNYYE